MINSAVRSGAANGEHAGDSDGRSPPISATVLAEAATHPPPPELEITDEKEGRRETWNSSWLPESVCNRSGSVSTDSSNSRPISCLQWYLYIQKRGLRVP